MCNLMFAGTGITVAEGLPACAALPAAAPPEGQGLQ